MEEKKKAGKRVAKPEGAGRGKQIAKGIYIAITIISALIVLGYLAMQFIFVKPNVAPKPSANVGTGNNGSTVVEPLPGVSQQPEKDSTRKSDDFYTILVVGRDTGGGGNTDVIMLVSYDVTNQKMAVMNIPRDTMVNLAIDLKKINAVYNTYGKGDDGIAALCSFVGDTVGVVPDFHVIIEWDAVGRLGQAIGGVDFNVPISMTYDDPYQNLSIRIPAGWQTLNGDAMMKVLRFRQNNDGSGYPDGDIGRIATQQALLKEVAKKLLQPSMIGKVPELVDIFNDNVETDLSIQNLLWFAKSAVEGGLDASSINFCTMPADYNGYAFSRVNKNNQSYVFPIIDEILELVNADFNPLIEDVTADDLDIMYKNSDGTIASTSGVLRDNEANPAWITYKNTPKATPKPSPTPTVAPSPEPTSPAVTDPEGDIVPEPPHVDDPEPSTEPEPTATPEPTANPTPAPTTSNQPPEGITIN